MRDAAFCVWDGGFACGEKDGAMKSLQQAFKGFPLPGLRRMGARLAQRARAFGGDRSGNVFALFALSLVPITAFTGIAVDFSRISAAHSRLAQATDAVALAIARNAIFDTAEGWATAETYFDANYPHDTFGPGEITDIKLLSDRVDVESIATIKTLIVGLIGYDYSTISAASQVRRPVGGIEVAMVLDNTGSMNGNNKIKDLRKAATDLTEFMFDNIEDPTGQVAKPLKIALVPFVTTVNVRTPGVFNWSWIDTDAESDYHGANFLHYEGGAIDLNRTVNHFDLFRSTTTDWKGCVEMRPSSIDPNLSEVINYDVSDIPPTSTEPNSLWVPYFWPDEPDCSNGACGSSSVGGSVPKEKEYHNRTYIKDKEYAKDSPERDTYEAFLDAAALIPELAGVPEYQLRQMYVGEYDAGDEEYDHKLGLNPSIDEFAADGATGTSGPNKSCPRPIVELTDDEQRLLDEIDLMAPHGGGGTNIAAGLSWGWRVLTPSSPYTQGEPKNSPFAKYIIVLTDGENWVWGGWKSHNKSNYSGYGYLRQERLGAGITAKNSAAAKIDDKVADLCAAIADDGITLYTITFQ
ncbi:MAG: pilus assembly protein, partial [Pseudomonadota bacterium]